MSEVDGEDVKNWFAENAATFGDRLAAARENAGLSQKELAVRVGVKLKVLSNWESDASEPRANRLTLLAGMLGVSMRWLMVGEGEGPEPIQDEGDVDVASILTEMRALRVQMQQAAVKMGQLEKKLRQAVGTIA